MLFVDADVHVGRGDVGWPADAPVRCHVRPQRHRRGEVEHDSFHIPPAAADGLRTPWPLNRFLQLFLSIRAYRASVLVSVFSKGIRITLPWNRRVALAGSNWSIIWSPNGRNVDNLAETVRFRDRVRSLASQLRCHDRQDRTVQVRRHNALPHSIAIGGPHRLADVCVPLSLLTYSHVERVHGPAETVAEHSRVARLPERAWG